MVFYDCDDQDQFEILEARVADDDLLQRNLLQAFAPDEPFEAVNRGFKALRLRRPRTKSTDFWAPGGGSGPPS
jgi:hypothetical protein